MAKEKQEIVASMPLHIFLPRKTKEDRKIHINLNQYRNWQGHMNNQIKQIYKDLVIELNPHLKDVRFKNQIELLFVMHRKDKRIVDRSNVLSIHEKFFCDALTHLGCLEDDNDKYIKRTIYETGEKDKENPRVDIFIRELSNNG